MQCRSTAAFQSKFAVFSSSSTGESVFCAPFWPEIWPIKLRHVLHNTYIIWFILTQMADGSPVETVTFSCTLHVSKNDDFCIRNEEFCIKNEELCIENEELCVKHDEFCRPTVRSR